MKSISENQKIFILILASLAFFEALSFTGYFIPSFTYLGALIILLGALALTLEDPFYGFLIIIVELLVGSQGYLFWLGDGADRVSLRIALWLLVMAVWGSKELFSFVKHREVSKQLKQFPYYKPLALLLTSIFIAAGIGYFRSHDLGLLFDELKRWIFLITIVPLFITFKATSKQRLLLIALASAGLWIAIKSFALLFIFSHEMPLIESLYSWTRLNLLGEITRLPNGFSRVFLQSQVFVIPSFFIALAIFVKKLRDTKWKFTRATYTSAGAAALFLSVILISLSRSFWLGAVLGLILASVAAIIHFRPNIRLLPVFAVYGLIIAAISSVLLYGSVRFPFPRPITDISASLITDRATEFEAGAASRWALLPVMKAAISEHPLEGSGLGKTLTYITSDPRVRQHSPDGSYTTNAFEWGWLDLWLKLGVLGVVAMIWLLLAIAKRAWNKISTKPILAFPVLAALVSLVALNMFTPYLNHPLGFGYLAILMVLANTES